MSASTCERALEPFFTTKPNGSGLGLPAAYGIVTQLGGEFGLRSSEGEGTTVEVRLPTGGAARPESAPRPPTISGPRTPVLLVVDDEKAIRRVMERFLSRSGYRVRLAANGAKALELLDDDVDLVVSDIRMPGMNGSELATKIRAERPAMPIVLMSGYTEHAVDRAEGTAFVAKPFDPAVLLDLIATLLARP
jgi:CheY-like chemotaxis protein